jgi:hypothetical protein
MIVSRDRQPRSSAMAPASGCQRSGEASFGPAEFKIIVALIQRCRGGRLRAARIGRAIDNASHKFEDIWADLRNGHDAVFRNCDVM